MLWMMALIWVLRVLLSRHKGENDTLTVNFEYFTVNFEYFTVNFEYFTVG